MNRRTALMALAGGLATGAEPPLRMCMAGLAHGHAGGFLRRYLDRQDLVLAGISEEADAVRREYADRYKIEPSRMYASLDEMLDKIKPEGVVTFTSTFDHLRVVEACAKRKLPVMMEKPLAVSVEHGQRMKRLSEQTGIPVLVNYETTWYASNQAVWSLAKEQGKLGEIRKMVAHDGHRGPKEIGVGPEFLEWLTDPEKNGAGALYDFGCYGANLMTWLMDNRRPRSVTAITQTLKPDIYPKVDDEATVILEYERAQGIIQASWNWPHDRKDFEVYGKTGQAITVRGDRVRFRLENAQEEWLEAPPLAPPQDDFLRYFGAVIRKQIQPAGLSSLENNMIVTEILDAARRSSKQGRTIGL